MFFVFTCLLAKSVVYYDKQKMNAIFKKQKVNVNSKHHNLSNHKHRLYINIVNQIQENQVILHMIKDVSSGNASYQDVGYENKNKTKNNVPFIYMYIHIGVLNHFGSVLFMKTQQ